LSRITVIGGTASNILAGKIAKKINAFYIKSKLRKFPDGEIKTTLSAIPKKGKIVVVQSCYPPVNDNLIEIFALLSKAKKYSSNIIAVIPYLGYARQDKEFLPGEVITIKVVADLLRSAGASKILVIDIHSKMALKYFKIPAKDISAVPELVKYFKKLNLNNPLVVSPDMGGITRAKEFAKLFKSDFLGLQKQRNRKTGKVQIKNSNMKAATNRDLIIVDDMISTGDSIIKAAEFLKKQRCRKIFVACTHALLIDNAEKKIRKSGVTKIVSVNTIPGKTAVVDASSLIAKVIL